MFIKSGLKNILIFSIFLGLLSAIPLSAQNKGKTVTEKLEWSGDENVLEYKVEVRNKSTGELKSYTTQNNYIEISEAPGDFEFRVKAVDILGREGHPSGWQSFKITKALTPAINSFPSGGWQMPESAVDTAVIPVEIKNIQPRSKAQLVNSKTGEVVSAELVTRGTGASLVATGIKIPVLSSGDWKIKVVDPSGKTSESGSIKISNPWPEIRQKKAEEEARKLEEEKRLAEEKRRAEEKAEEERLLAEEKERQEKEKQEKLLAEQKEREEKPENDDQEIVSSEIKVRKKQKPSFELSAGYTLPVILFDDVIPKYMDNSAWPLSAIAKMNFIPIKTRAGNFGIGLMSTYTKMTADFKTYTIEGNFITAHFNLVYQIPMGKFVLELHGGAGVTGLLGFKYAYENDISSNTLNSLNLSYNAGAAYKFFILKGLFIEAGADFCYSALSDMKLGFVIPQVSAGWRF